MPKNSEDSLTALGKKKNSDLSETKFQKKRFGYRMKIF